jgi:hypothetical protein
LYANGDGVPQDAQKAFAYYRKSAAQGNADALYNLGMLYLNGTGVEADTDNAVKQFTLSAQQGDADAEYVLGQFYAGNQTTGLQSVAEGATQTQTFSNLQEDDVRAYMLYNLAAAQGDADAQTAKAALQANMTADEIASAQAMSSTWQLNSPFPISSYEDRASQEFRQGVESNSDVVQNTSVWFSVSFVSSGEPRYAVFLKTKGTEADNDAGHAAGAEISVATFSDANDPSESSYGDLQANLTQSGIFGDVYSQPDLHQSFDTPKRVGRLQYDLGDGRLALLVPDEDMAQGEDIGGYQIFVFDGKADHGSGTWAPGGDIDTFDGDKADCDDSGKPFIGTLGCFAWTGSVRLMPSSNDGWPELIVHATGTAENSTYSKLIPAPDIIYSFDGQRFIQVSPPPVQ